jgi:nucleoside-diphosphate-sugar epimerase
MAPISSDLILMTGITGHVGFRTLIHALRAGYSVRAAVRSEAKAQSILSHRKIQSLHLGSRLTFIIVPDLAAPFAYDEAVRGVHYIIHIASPLMTGRNAPLDNDNLFVKPAVHGTLGMLEAAKKSCSVRRIIITSSIVALVPLPQLNGVERPERPVLPTDRVPFAPGPYENEFAAYAASKVAALAEAESWIQTQKPSFDVVHLHPSFVLGRNDLAMHTREALKGTNAIILGMTLGKKLGPIASASVHNEDVARVHVQALDAAVPGNQSYILSQKTHWEDVQGIVQRQFADSVANRTLPNCGGAGTLELAVDASLTEATFGFKHLGLKQQVKSVVGHYLELRSKTRMVSKQVESAVDSCHQVRVNA